VVPVAPVPAPGVTGFTVVAGVPVDPVVPGVVPPIGVHCVPEASVLRVVPAEVPVPPIVPLPAAPATVEPVDPVPAFAP
jgi:hypothetical protein